MIERNHSMDIYYVYAYLRSKDSDTAKAGTPYYIGKGKGDRAIRKHPGVTVPGDRSKIVLIEQNLTNIGACAIERRLIAWYGRKDLGTGILLNRTYGADGGKGGSPKGRVFSERTRKKLSAAGFRRKDPDEVKARKSAAAKLRWSKVSKMDRKNHMTKAFDAQPRNCHS
jgi:hypothetical protein